MKDPPLQEDAESHKNLLSFFLSFKLEHHIQEFRSAQDRLAEVRDKYKEGSTGVNDLTRELAQVSRYHNFDICSCMTLNSGSLCWSGTFILCISSILNLEF